MLRRIAVALTLAAVFGFASDASAQAVSIDLGGEGALTLQIVQLFMLLTVLSLAPGIAIMITCFPFMVTVLSILRQAVGVQQAPPNMMIVSLALFLTYFVMAPVFNVAWEQGVQPLLAGEITAEAAFSETMAPFRVFMEGRVDPNTIEALREAAPQAAAVDAGPPDPDAATPLSLLVPSFLLSEVKRAFEIGFLIFIPFLIIDLVVASILMAMGMMMVPPAIVSLPFKLAFFVLADGWTLLAGALVRGYGT
ncbi:flagellar type III secretion system pore protein FliP [Pikeienuella sp. HZG-20]|uniref:flagellar type III secretion system pore protein FliP n=1 Tax=Paludibacillus litoralis TaxID=3133267 RepID=UPI0030ECA00D